MIKTLIIILITLVVLISGLIYIYWPTDPESVLVEDGPSEIISFTIEKPYLVARGRRLDLVEVYAKLALTEATEVVLLGPAELERGDELERWLWLIPEEPILAEEIFARGYAEGEVVGERALNIKGQVGLYNGLWSTGQTMLFPLKVGQTGTFQDLSLKFNQVVADSRCPIDVTCVWAGDFKVLVTLTANGSEKSLELSDINEPHLFDDYLIDIVKVEPPAKSASEERKYVVTFSVIKNSEL